MPRTWTPAEVTLMDQIENDLIQQGTLREGIPSRLQAELELLRQQEGAPYTLADIRRSKDIAKRVRLSSERHASPLGLSTHQLERLIRWADKRPDMTLPQAKMLLDAEAEAQKLGL